MLFDNYTLGLLVFAISMVATPGPANMILLSAGSQIGFIKSVPFVFRQWKNYQGQFDFRYIFREQKQYILRDSELLLKKSSLPKWNSHTG